MTRVFPSARRRDGQTRIGAIDKDSAVDAGPQPSANDTTELKWDHLALVNFVDALAEYTADLLTEGRLDDLARVRQIGNPGDRKITFTSARPPFIK